MEVISSTMIEEMCAQHKKRFEQLLPEIVKRLIVASNSSVIGHRFPAYDDIWAPGNGVLFSCS